MIINRYAKGGGLSPRIVVTAATGSTVTCTKGSTTLTATEVSGKWTFNLNDFGTWTVSATLGDKSATKDVDVVWAQLYEVTLKYVSTTLNDNDWATIRDIADASEGANYWSVGDTKQVTINGKLSDGLTLNNYSTWVYIIGFDHNKNIEGTGIAFGCFKTAQTGGVSIAFIDSGYGTDYSTWQYFNMNNSRSNSGGWKSSLMRTTTIPIVKNTLPSDLQSVLKSTIIYTDNAGGGSSVAKNVTATNDELYLLSEFEIFGVRTYANSYEQNYQQQYSYYSAGNSKIKYKYNATSEAVDWYGRSPGSNESSFVGVAAAGNVGNMVAQRSLAFVPSFKVGGLGGPAASIKVMGMSQSDTVTAAMGSKTKTAKWVTVPNPALHGLPDGYTELESIESTGTQYIDTGVNVDNNLGVEMDFVNKSPISTTKGEFGSFFGGCKLLNSSINIRVWIGTIKTGSYAGVFDWNLTTYNGGLSVGTRMQLSLRNGIYTTSNGVSVTLPTATFDAAQNAYLFAANKGGTPFEHAKVLLYSCKVYSGDTLARNFIPAKRNSDGAIGLYDLVTTAFFPNAGTGVFTAGAEIQSSVSYWLIDGIRDFGTWTVTATNGTKTATQDVLVDVITEYEITMAYRFYLYNEGDECEDVTGGWTIDGYVYTGQAYTPAAGAKNSDNFYLKKSAGTSTRLFGTTNKINLSYYSTLHAVFYYNDTEKTDPWVGVLLDGKDLVGSNRYPNACLGNGVDDDITASADISELSGYHYIVAASTTTDGGGYVYKIWLE